MHFVQRYPSISIILQKKKILVLKTPPHAYVIWFYESEINSDAAKSA